jgi:hypothetical protein
MKKSIARACIEVGFIIFLFYSNLLMGQFTRSGMGRKFGLFWSVKNIFTLENFIIAIIMAFIGYVIFESLREQY